MIQKKTTTLEKEMEACQLKETSSQDYSRSSKDGGKAAGKRKLYPNDFEFYKTLNREQIAEELEALRRMAKETPTLETEDKIGILEMFEENIAMKMTTVGAVQLEKIYSDQYHTLLDERGCFTAEVEKNFVEAGLLEKAKYLKKCEDYMRQILAKKRLRRSYNSILWDTLAEEIREGEATWDDVIDSRIEPGKPLFCRGPLPGGSFEREDIPKEFIDMAEIYLTGQHLCGRKI